MQVIRYDCHLFIYLTNSLSIYRNIYLTYSISIYLTYSTSIYLTKYIYLSISHICVTIYSFLFLSFYLSNCTSFYLTTYIPIHIPIYLTACVYLSYYSYLSIYILHRSAHGLIEIFIFFIFAAKILPLANFILVH